MDGLLIYKRRGVWRVARLGRSLAYHSGRWQRVQTQLVFNYNAIDRGPTRNIPGFRPLLRGKYDYDVSIRYHYWWNSLAGDCHWWVRLARSQLPERWQPRALAIAANVAFLKPRCVLVGWLLAGERGVEQFEALVADYSFVDKSNGDLPFRRKLHWRYRADCFKLCLSCMLDSIDNHIRPLSR